MTGRRLFGYPSVNKMRFAGSVFLLCWALSAEAGGAGEVSLGAALGQPSPTTEQYRIQARIDLLATEARGRQRVEFNPELLKAASSDPAVAALLAETRNQFELRSGELQQRQMNLRERIDSSTASIKGQEQQLNSNRRRLEMIRGKLKGLEPAIEKGLIGQNYVSALSSEVEQLSQQCDELEASIAQTKWKVAEYALEQSRQESGRREVVQAELASLKARLRWGSAGAGEEALASQVSNPDRDRSSVGVSSNL